jgi:MFS transporter, DHA1 family, multidrug resistance protein
MTLQKEQAGPDARAPVAPVVHHPMSFIEFVAMVAALMALNALAIDVMLPALQEIGVSLAVADENHRQTVLSAYLVGFGAGQLLIGSVSDRFGRRPVLIFGLALYIAAAAVCAIAPTFEALLVARVLQGLASAAPRVVTISIVRDSYGGPRMAKVMSLSMMVFMAVPVVAPSVGQLVILVASWRMIFVLLTLYGLVMMAWTWLRLPETLKPSDRRSFAPRQLLRSFGEVIATRQTSCYAIAGGLMFGAIFSFLVSAQQIFTDIFRLGPYFPLAFAGVAAVMSMASFLNSRLLGRLGMRRISHAAVLSFTALALCTMILARLDALVFPVFMVLLAGIMFLLGLIFSNFNSLAMEPQAHIAGTASSVFGSITTLIASVIGYVVGQAYDGTLVPLTTGYFVFGLATLGTLLVAERGRLFGVRPLPLQGPTGSGRTDRP